jgi:hypothetical protein
LSCEFEGGNDNEKGVRIVGNKGEYENFKG